MHATIDEPCIFTRALTPVEIALLHGGLRCDEAASISLDPGVAFNSVDTNHTVTATISPAVADIPVEFDVTAGPNFGEGGTDSTDGSGVANFTYTGDGGDGIDTITACIDLNESDTCDAGEPTATATKTWFENFLTGGGKVNFIAGNTKKAEWTFGGTVGFLESAGPVGQFQIVHHVEPAVACHFDTFTSLVFSGTATTSPPASNNEATFAATGDCNDATSRSIQVSIHDVDEPGKDNDTISWTWTVDGLPNLDPGTTLDGGNLQVHDIDS